MHELEQYPIPTDVQMEVDKYGQYRDLNAWNVRTNYKRRLHSLLWIEEVFCFSSQALFLCSVLPDYSSWVH